MDNRWDLPATPGELTPMWLTHALRETGTLRRGTVEDVVWSVIGEQRGFTGALARLELTYRDADDDDQAPASLIAKFPTAPRAGGGRPGEAAFRTHYERCAREVRFYTDIAPCGAAPAPRLYYAAADDATARIVLLLEDVSGARAGDVLAGCSPQDAQFVLRAMAPFHTRWWTQPSRPATDWLPRWAGDQRARQERYNRQVDPFLEQFGAGLPAPILNLIERLRQEYGAVLAALDRAPTTIVHGDLHLDNILFQPPGGVSPVVVLDWQGVGVGAAAVDVSLFVVGSLSVADRRETKGDLLADYHTLLVEAGVRGYTLEQFRDDYRLALVRQLAGVVGWLSAITVDRPAGRERAVAEAALGDGRLVAALLDHEVDALPPA